MFPEFEIKFIDTNNKALDGSNIIIADTSEGLSINEDNWIVHPAFTFGDIELPGIWVAKYEASSSAVISSVPSTTIQNKSTLFVNVKPSTKENTVWSWTYVSTTNAYKVCQYMKNEGGALEGSNSSDSHMMKNVEWGAVAYLTQSKYGQMRNEASGQVYINNYKKNSSAEAPQPGFAGATPGAATATDDSEVYEYNTTNGVKASSTGTIYGIYDLSGGAWERTTSYLANSTASSNSNIQNIITAANDPNTAKYVEVYVADLEVDTEATANDQKAAHYAKLVNNNKMIRWGDAIYETSYSSTGNTSWQKDYSQYSYGSSQTLVRGGKISSGAYSGIFAFYYTAGAANAAIGFRPVCLGFN